MGIGFEVILATDKKAEFNLFPPQQSSKESLITFAQDSTTAIAAVLMGRIYYQDDLKNHFPEAFQQDFTSDAALVLAIFRHAGSKGLEQLEGEFALVIFDPEPQCLVTMRDPLGSWPLYWTHDGQTLRVSNSLRLLAGKLPQAHLDLDFISLFLVYPYPAVELPTEQTAFEKIRRILPGTIMALYPDGRKTLSWCWDWMEKISDVGDITLEDAGLQFAQLFRQAVKERIKHGKIASHLSGGMDSSAVVCVARDYMSTGIVSGRLNTLSMVYQMPSLAGEKDYIKMIVNQGGPIDPHYLDGDAALDFQWFTDDFPNHDEPYSSLYRLAMEKALFKTAHKLGITTILNGIGAELIVEGNRYHLADLMLSGHWLAALKEARQWAYAKNMSPWSVLRQFAIEPLLPPLLREGMGTLMRRGYGRWPKQGLFAIPPWILPDFAHKYGMWSKALVTMRQLNRYPVEQSFNLMSFQVAAGNWSSWYLGAPLGIRTCQPFLDPRPIVYCLGLPRGLREIPGVSKPILKSAMSGILPEEILNRRLKVSFDEVYWKGLSRNLPHLEEMIDRSQINDLGIFDKQQLIKVMRQHAIGVGNVRSGIPIVRMLALIAWFDQIQKLMS